MGLSQPKGMPLKMVNCLGPRGRKPQLVRPARTLTLKMSHQRIKISLNAAVYDPSLGKNEPLEEYKENEDMHSIEFDSECEDENDNDDVPS